MIKAGNWGAADMSQRGFVRMKWLAQEVEGPPETKTYWRIKKTTRYELKRVKRAGGVKLRDDVFVFDGIPSYNRGLEQLTKSEAFAGYRSPEYHLKGAKLAREAIKAVSKEKKQWQPEVTG